MRERRHELDGLAMEAHERVPHLLVRDRREARRARVRAHERIEPGDVGVLRVDGPGEREVALGVLVAVVHDRLRGERTEVRERGVHLRGGALEEAAAPCDEERVAGEDAAGVGGACGAGDVIADGVLCVARSGKTPAGGRRANLS